MTANLFMRPRRFGKSLNLSTLRYYFERAEDGESRGRLFDGLKIMSAGDAYTSHQGRYPVIMLTLKSAKQETYALAYRCLREALANEFVRHNEVLLSLTTDVKKEKFCRLRDELADEGEYRTALAFLSECLYRHYGEKVIILIDEYDVRLESAYYAGFYDEMISFIRPLFEPALKTNPSLEFAVITGCLRISRESIFTGLNNLKMREAGDGRYDICVRSLDVSQAPVILELKVSDTFKGMESSCRQALKQIYDKHYDDVLPEEGYTEVLNYGIAFSGNSAG